MKSLQDFLNEDFTLKNKGKIKTIPNITDYEYVILKLIGNDFLSLRYETEKKSLGHLFYKDELCRKHNYSGRCCYILKPNDAIEIFKKSAEDETALYAPPKEYTLNKLQKYLNQGDYGLPDDIILQEIKKETII